MSKECYITEYTAFVQEWKAGNKRFPDFSNYTISKPVLFLLGGHCHKDHCFLSIIETEDDHWLENTHDFIQWVFPLDEPSRSLRHAPVLTAMDIKFLQHNFSAMHHLLALSGRMKRFWQMNQHWIKHYDHNHLRITRAIKSLRLILGNQHAEEFKQWLYDLLGSDIKKINENTQQFWRRA